MSNLVLSSEETEIVFDSLYNIRSVIESVSHEETKRKIKELIAHLGVKVLHSVNSEKFVKDLNFYIGEEFYDDWETAIKRVGYEDGYKWEIPTIYDLIQINKCMDNPFTNDEVYWSSDPYRKLQAETYQFYSESIDTRPKKESNYYFYISRKGEQNV
jgi:hypothetical protein